MSNPLIKYNRNKEGVDYIILNRPEVHNAFNDELIEKLTQLFNQLSHDPETRVVVLQGEGKSFSAGADLNWMKSMAAYSKEENIQDSIKLARMFESMNNLPVPLIGVVQGHCLGGGLGLVAVCDYVLAHAKAKFGFTEVRLGLIPAVISPYCIKKIGESHARALFLSGERFDVAKAQQISLVHQVYAQDGQEELEAIIDSFLSAAPMATRKAKELIKRLDSVKDSAKMQFTCEQIAECRVSDEGQAGMQGLLNKQMVNWRLTK